MYTGKMKKYFPNLSSIMLEQSTASFADKIPVTSSAFIVDFGTNRSINQHDVRKNGAPAVEISAPVAWALCLEPPRLYLMLKSVEPVREQSKRVDSLTSRGTAGLLVYVM